jgi:Tol biopolymer transport system component
MWAFRARATPLTAGRDARKGQEPVAATRKLGEPRARPSLLLSLGLAALLAALMLGSAAAHESGNRTACPSSGSLIQITTASDDSRWSYRPRVSADGTKIVFASDSDFLDQGIPDQQFEIWSFDTVTMKLTRLTRATDSARSSGAPSVSADGTRVAFVSDADFLGEGLPDGNSSIWLYDTRTMSYTRLATALDNWWEYRRTVGAPAISGDGSRVAFHSNSPLLGQDLRRYSAEIWLYDTATMTLTRATTASQDYRSSVSPSLNGDGTRIAFYGNSDLLGQGLPYDQFEVWLYDTATTSITRITTSPNGDSTAPHISADGTRIVFNSSADLLDLGTKGFEVWLYDTVTLTYTRVTSSEIPRDSWTHAPTMSGSGEKIAFISDSDFLGDDAMAGQYRLWLYDTTTMTYTCVSDSSRGGFGSEPASLSVDGMVLAFAQGGEIWLFKPFSDPETPTVVPEAATVTLMLAGLTALVGFGAARWRRGRE